MYLITVENCKCVLLYNFKVVVIPEAVEYVFYGIEVGRVNQQPYAAQYVGIHGGKTCHGFVLEVKRYAGILQQVL